MRKHRALALFFATATLGVIPGPSSAEAPIIGRLLADRVEVPQGVALGFRLRLVNRSSQLQTVDMALELRRAQGGAGSPFARIIQVIAPADAITVPLSVTPSQWFAGRGRFKIVVSDGLPAAALRFRVTGSPRVRPRFTDVTGSTGLSTRHHAPLIADCNWAAGAAWGDVEGDGDLDLYLPHQSAAAQLFIDYGGTFVDEAAARGVANEGGIGIGAVFADYDRDGDQDLYVTNDGVSRLYRNNGGGIFADVAAAAGVLVDGPSTSAAWGDYDRDGLLDLYVVGYGRCGGADVQQKLVYAEDHLFHNKGDGTFTDVTTLLGPAAATRGAGFQAAWVDYDHDGDQDLYLGNDFVGPQPRPNVLWRNDGAVEGGWKFTDVSIPSGAGISINTMGIAVGDPDRDGRLDLALSNIEANVLLKNRGDGTFSDIAEARGVGRPTQRILERSVTWGGGFHDFNLDGWEDLYFAAGAFGHETNPENQPNALFVNRGKKRFLDLSAPSRADDPSMTRGVAFADYDRDGRMDMYLVNRSGFPRLMRNVTPRGNQHWLEVDLIGSASNSDACGARLTAKVGNAWLVRIISCGSTSLSSGSDTVAHFGLGRFRKASKLTIEWPSGRVQVLRDVRGDRLLSVQEPSA